MAPFQLLPKNRPMAKAGKLVVKHQKPRTPEKTPAYSFKTHPHWRNDYLILEDDDTIMDWHRKDTGLECKSLPSLLDDALSDWFIVGFDIAHLYKDYPLEKYDRRALLRKFFKERKGIPGETLNRLALRHHERRFKDDAEVYHFARQNHLPIFSPDEKKARAPIPAKETPKLSPKLLKEQDDHTLNSVDEIVTWNNRETIYHRALTTIPAMLDHALMDRHIMGEDCAAPFKHYMKKHSSGKLGNVFLRKFLKEKKGISGYTLLDLTLQHRALPFKDDSEVYDYARQEGLFVLSPMSTEVSLLVFGDLKTSSSSSEGEDSSEESLLHSSGSQLDPYFPQTQPSFVLNTSSASSDEEESSESVHHSSGSQQDPSFPQTQPSSFI